MNLPTGWPGAEVSQYYSSAHENVETLAQCQEKVPFLKRMCIGLRGSTSTDVMLYQELSHL